MNQKRILAVALFAALTLSLTACNTQQQEETSTPSDELSTPVGVAVQVETISTDTISSQNKVNGTVVTEGQTNVMVSTSAKCTAVHVKVGDYVKAGQSLCTLDLGSTLSSYNAAVITYDSSVQTYDEQKAVLDAQIALYEKTVNDLKALFEIGAAAQLEIDQAELQLQSAKASRNSTLAQMEAGMQSAKSNVEQLTSVLENIDSNGNVIAPTSGVLLSVNAAKNGFVSNASPVAVIDGVNRLEIAVSVSEALIPQLSVGDSVDVSVSAIDANFSTKIRSIERTANAQTKLYTVTLSIPSSVKGLLSGMFTDVTFHTNKSENAVVIPTEAILTSNEISYVYIVEDGTAHYVEVETGLTGSGVTEVLSGLNVGDQLVTVGQAYLADGDPVRIVNGEE